MTANNNYNDCGTPASLRKDRYNAKLKKYLVEVDDEEESFSGDEEREKMETQVSGDATW